MKRSLEKLITDREIELTVGKDEVREAPPLTLSQGGTVRGIVRSDEGKPDGDHRTAALTQSRVPRQE